MAASRLRLNMDKTELIWTGTKHNLSKIPGSGRALTHGAAHVAQSDDVRVLGVQLSSDLSLDKHVNVVSAIVLLSTTTTTPHPTFSGWRLCRYTRSCVRREPSGLLRQSPDWRSEEDDRQIATCHQLSSTNRLEHAQVRPGTHSFPAMSAALAGCCRPGSVQSLRPGVQMSAQDNSWIPVYLLPTRGRRHLRSADRGHLDFLRLKLASYGGRSFAYAGPSNWNSLPAYLRDSNLSLSSFKHHQSQNLSLLFLLG